MDVHDVATPNTLTILTTYRCTAACKQCCFESSPSIEGRLSKETIIQRITEATEVFPTLQVVVFSGGEATLLKDDLYSAIKHATDSGLKTRVVSNGSWGKTAGSAQRVARHLRESGLTEINISTGADHQEWVPVQSVINAAAALVNSEISTLITVEADDKENTRFREIADHPDIKTLVKRGKLHLQTNIWMAFHSSAERREQSIPTETLRKGCAQIFGNAVITPHDNLSACCGLTLEHIPEMRLGKLTTGNMYQLYATQFDDFLKYWIKVDGPYKIIESIFPDDSEKWLNGVNHICQACVILHKTEEIKKRMLDTFQDHVQRVMTTFSLEEAVNSKLI